MGQGPLNRVKIVEFAGIGPVPLCGMLLSDLGADVVRIDRAGREGPSAPHDVLSRGRRSVAVNLKDEAGRDTVRALLKKADGLLEGFRPGVMERLGLGPDNVLGLQPNLIYGRMTGWGQDGPLSQSAGHDLNYIALTGALHAMGEKDGRPRPPLNLVGDYGGGTMFLAFGMLAGLLNVKNGGTGQVVDCAMTDGTATLMTMFYAMRAQGIWTDEREANLLDGGAYFYDTYTCADGKWVAIGSIEPQFYALLREKAGLSDPEFDAQFSRANWPTLKRKLADIIATKTRDEWCDLMEGTDVCFAPVLSMAEAPQHPHNIARGTFEDRDGVVQPAPAPRFSATPGAIAGPPAGIGEHTAEVLKDWGIELT